MTILLTKVRPPQRRKDILRRVRLVDTLHQNMHRKLTFVSAPAGYGKTTLLVDFAADVDAIVCWYRIGPEDGDLVQFVRHIVASFQQQIPEFGQALEQRLTMGGSSPDAPSLAAELINEVELQVPDFAVLILDDYHLAGENQQVVDFIENLLEHLPDQLRILMGSRSVYGIPTANLYIRDELITINADELRFRAEELQKLVLQNYRTHLSREQAEELAKRADGWIIALLLAVRSMENGNIPKFNGAIEQVYEYLAEEVVNRQSEELRDFMFSTSILGDFNEAQCNFLLERRDSDSLLRALEERNLFVSRTETTEGPSYRYHQLFSEFLQDFFGREFGDRKRAAHQRAAEWHRGREEWENAINHKLEAGDREEAAAWMDNVAVQFYTSGRQNLLARWIKSLAKSPDSREKAPHLLLYQAKSLVNQNNFDTSLQLLDIAEPVFKANKDGEAEANAITTRGMVARFTGKYADALELASEAQRTLAEKGNKHSLQWFQAERLKAIPAFYLGEMAEAIKHLDTAINGLRGMVKNSKGSARSTYLFDLAECLNDLGLLYIDSGQMLNAQKAFQEALDIHVSIRSNLGALASARNNIAYLHHQIGHYPEAWREYSLAFENAKSANRVREQIAILIGRGELLLDLDEREEARTHFEDAIQLGQQHGETQILAVAYSGLARVERLNENHNEAMSWLRQAASLPAGGLDPLEYTVELGQIYSAMGQIDLAQKQFQSAIRDWPADKIPRQGQVLAAFLGSRGYYRKGDSAKAEELLEQTLHGVAQLGYDQFLVAMAHHCEEFTEKLQGAPQSAQLATLLQRIADFQTGKAVVEAKADAVELPPMNLQVQAFGLGEVRKDSEILPTTAWRSSRARALFFYILSEGKARKEAIGLDFWPDFSVGKISSNFHATLWRVRQALGFKEAIVFEDDMYSLHPSIQVWYDVLEFRNYLKQAEAPNLSVAEQSEILRQAVRLYQGPFLQDLYMDWADRQREELRSLYLDALSSLATLEVHAKRHKEAKDLYEKIVSIDPYRDEVHLALMKSLVLSGSTSAAIAHFKRYKTLLRKELNAEPLEELQSYYDQLAIRA